MEQFNILDLDMQKATFAAITLLAILLWICVFFKTVLIIITAIFTAYAVYLGYLEFGKPKQAKNGLKTHSKEVL